MRKACKGELRKSLELAAIVSGYGLEDLGKLIFAIFVPKDLHSSHHRGRVLTWDLDGQVKIRDFLHKSENDRFILGYRRKEPDTFRYPVSCVDSTGFERLRI